jgi:uncharacterized membrane protein YecN with MAPEG domain
MEYTALIILLALLQFLLFGVRVGIARGKYGIKAPATLGDETWERMYRVQQNTMEQLVVFIPAVIAFSVYVSNRWVLLPGLLFLVGRQLYSYEYIKNPDSRVPGMAISLLCNAALVIGALIGLLLVIF